MEIDFDKKMTNAIKNFHAKGVEYANAKALSWQLQELRKTILSEEMVKLEGSISEREMRARASEAYQTHLIGTSEAIRKEAVALAERESWRLSFEKYRSLCSQETSKIKAIGGTDMDSGEAESED